MTPAGERIGRRDVAITVVLSLLAVALMVDNVRLLNQPVIDPDQTAAVHIGALLPFWFGVPLILLVTVPLLWRRAAPLPALGAASVGLLVNLALVGSEYLRCGIVLIVAMLLAFRIGSQLDGRDARLGLGLSLALAATPLLLEIGPEMAAVLTTLTGVVWGIGRIAHSRRRMADELRVRNAELRGARDERARLEVAADRARLSRELDGLLQRRLGELARMAGEGPADPAGATALLVDIERESRRTLEDMRAAVGVLRNDESELPTAPQPTLTHLDALLVRAKGGDARLTVDGSPRVLPPAVELSAYRIVEHLLAALEDAPGVEVRIRFGDDALELAVSGPARRGARAAIGRARERTRLQQGTFDATVRGGRADAVALIPAV